MISHQQVYFPPDEIVLILADIGRVLQSGRLTLGPETAALEAEFARCAGTRHAIAAASGTAALEIVLRVLGVAGREVIVPANTFYATAAAVLHAGGIPVFCDVESDTMMPSVRTVAHAVGPETAGVILVHVGGSIAPDYPALLEWCQSAGRWLIEDAAHAAGSRWGDRPAGSLGRAAAFSLYPTKVVTACEGGIITTDDTAIAQEARIYRDQGKTDFASNRHVRLGGSWRLSEVHAIIGRSQLRCLDAFLLARQRVAKVYDAELRAVRPWPVAASVRSNYYKYCARLPDRVDREALKALLASRHQVGLTGEVYDLPLHRQEILRPFARGPLPGADDVCARMICLPMSATITEADARAVARAVEDVCAAF